MMFGLSFEKYLFLYQSSPLNIGYMTPLVLPGIGTDMNIKLEVAFTVMELQS